MGEDTYYEVGLNNLQQEVGPWAEENFGDEQDIRRSMNARGRKDSGEYDPGADIGALFCVLGVNEEAGELTHSVLKRAQGIRDDDPNVGPEAEMDAVADIVIYLADFCHRRGYSLAEAVHKAWYDEVSDREWDSDTRSD